MSKQLTCPHCEYVFEIKLTPVQNFAYVGISAKKTHPHHLIAVEEDCPDCQQEVFLLFSSGDVSPREYAETLVYQSVDVWKRRNAYGVDFGIILFLFLGPIIFMLSVMPAISSKITSSDITFSNNGLVIVCIFFFIMYLIYFTVFIWFSGTTPGNALFGFQITKRDRSPWDFRSALIYVIFVCIDMILSPILDLISDINQIKSGNQETKERPTDVIIINKTRGPEQGKEVINLVEAGVSYVLLNTIIILLVLMLLIRF